MVGCEDFFKIWIIKTIAFFFCCVLVRWLDLTHSLSVGWAGLELTMWFRVAFTWDHRAQRHAKPALHFLLLPPGRPALESG